MKVEESSLATMSERGGSWACYENQAFDSAGAGQRQYLKFGPDCTFKEPPAHAPDTSCGLGWRYVLIGVVDLKAGEVRPLSEKKDDAVPNLGG